MTKTAAEGLERVGELLPCPFCGATPHQGSTKRNYGQDGEPLQGYKIWCPHSCAQFEQPSRELAIVAWNRRSALTAAIAVETKPVAWRAKSYSRETWELGLTQQGACDRACWNEQEVIEKIEPLYASPQPLAVETKPVGDWVMVPREPTQAMISAGFSEWRLCTFRSDTNQGADIYRAMLSAAPEAPQPLLDAPRVKALVEAAIFLLDRLDDFERDPLQEDDGEYTLRQFGGHVTPAMERLRNLIETSQLSALQSDGEGR